jgi:hypothetical protein
MTTTPSRQSGSSVADDAEPPVPTANAPSLGAAARIFADVAHAMRVAADHPTGIADIAQVLADIENGLSDLAVGAELTASAVIAGDRRPGASPTDVAPTPHARAISWGLHSLAAKLRASREVCAEVHRAARDDAGVQKTRRVQPPASRTASQRVSGGSRGAGSRQP